MKIKRYILLLWVILVIICLVILIIPLEHKPNYQMEEIDIFKFIETPDSRFIER